MIVLGNARQFVQGKSSNNRFVVGGGCRKEEECEKARDFVIVNNRMAQIKFASVQRIFRFVERWGSFVLYIFQTSMRNDWGFHFPISFAMTRNRMTARCARASVHGFSKIFNFRSEPSGERECVCNNSTSTY